jgi:ABC-type multidrug transport system ATPase subunit
VLLEIDGVTKFFEKGGNTITALDHVSLRADRPQVIGLVGLNGAGKTTLINIVAGILIPDEGIVRIDGEETWKKPIRLVAYPYIPYDDPRMKVREVVWVLENFYGKQKWDEYVEILGLKREWNTEIQRLSKGWRRRLDILSAMGQEKPVILLDEVTNGLDIETADAVLDAIRKKGKESIVIFASHIYAHVERVADRIVIIHEGRILMDRDNNLEEPLEKVLRRVIRGA